MAVNTIEPEEERNRPGKTWTLNRLMVAQAKLQNYLHNIDLNLIDTWLAYMVSLSKVFSKKLVIDSE